MNLDKIPCGNCTFLITGKAEISLSFKHWCVYVIKLLHCCTLSVQEEILGIHMLRLKWVIRHTKRTHKM